MERKLTPIRLPAELLKDIDDLVGPRQRSQFIVEASERELVRRKQLEVNKRYAGTWKDENYHEIPQTIEGLRQYLRRLRADATQAESPVHPASERPRGTPRV